MQYYLHGIKVFVNDKLTKQVRRTWRERLLTSPWRPWRKTKEVFSDQVFYTKDCGGMVNKVIMSPLVFDKVKDELTVDVLGNNVRIMNRVISEFRSVV